MVAFVVSFAIAILGMVVVHLYGRHRPVGSPLTWGEAIFAATFVFFLMFWAYGVVPNQWLQWANNELGWTPSKKLAQVGQWTFINAPLPPFTVEDLARFVCAESTDSADMPNAAAPNRI